MTRSADHLDDELLSAFVDDQVTPDEREQVQTHLRTCSACQQRLVELRAMVGLLQGLPEVPTPRDFKLGPRAVADPPNVIRLRRWYAATRVLTGSLAAGFVLLTAGVLYVDSRPGPAATSTVSKPQVALAPAAAPRTDSAPAPTVAPAAKAVAPAAVPAAAQASSAAAPGAAAAQRSVPAGQPGDQVAATTSVNPLPTPVPTPAPTAVPLPPPTPAVASPDEAIPLKLGAIAVGILAVLALVTAIAVRRRLQRAVSHL